MTLTQKQLSKIQDAYDDMIVCQSRHFELWQRYAMTPTMKQMSQIQDAYNNMIAAQSRHFELLQRQSMTPFHNFKHLTKAQMSQIQDAYDDTSVALQSLTKNRTSLTKETLREFQDAYGVLIAAQSRYFRLLQSQMEVVVQ